MNKRIKYNGKRITEAELRLLQGCNGKHSNIESLFSCGSCVVLLQVAA